MNSATPNTAFLTALTPALAEVAILDKAAGMAAYMKSSMPFMGVPSPTIRKTVRALNKIHPSTTVAQLQATAVQLWRHANYREERYSAIMLTDTRQARGELELLPFYTEVIETGQWWDFIDAVTPRLCELLLLHRATMEPLLREWSTHSNFWFRRAAILAQLAAKSQTDPRLLAELMAPNLADKEFFIRKAIGWALRQYARTDPDWVRRYVAAHEQQLSPLSRREALKHLG